MKSVLSPYSYEDKKMYEYEIRNGIGKSEHLRMKGMNSEAIRYLADDYSKGSARILFAGSRKWRHHRKLKFDISGRIPRPVIVRYATG